MDFYIINMDEKETTNPSPLLLWRPFMKMAKTKIDVFKGSLTIEINDKVTKFLIFDEKKVKNGSFACFAINVFANLFQGTSKGKDRGRKMDEMVMIGGVDVKEPP
ncbi:hypothetical protein REPUB_Repub06bG0105200 [Reevesia pubescens]